MEMNINEDVWVKLTPEGKETHRKYYRDIQKMKGAPPLYIKYGWAKFQMRELMSIFGRQCCSGHNQFKNNIIRFNPPMG